MADGMSMPWNPWTWFNTQAGGQQYPWLPGADWAQTPWSGYASDDAQTAAQRQGWMNTFLPWMQAYQQGDQWQQSFDWRKEADEFAQTLAANQFDWQKAVDQWSQGYQERQQKWAEDQDVWARGLQEQQLAQTAELENARRQAEQENTALVTFGRRWKPNTRWM